MTIELGYTITDCYSGNANYGHATQKQYVLLIDGELKNIFIKGYVNGPADTDRERVYHKIADITADQLATLQYISDNHNIINWNTGRYSVYTNLLSKNNYKAIKNAESEYINILMAICEPVNRKAEAKLIRGLKKFLKPFVSPKDYETCKSYLFTF